MEAISKKERKDIFLLKKKKENGLAKKKGKSSLTWTKNSDSTNPQKEKKSNSPVEQKEERAVLFNPGEKRQRKDEPNNKRKKTRHWKFDDQSPKKGSFGSEICLQCGGGEEKKMFDCPKREKENRSVSKKQDRIAEKEKGSPRFPSIVKGRKEKITKDAREEGKRRARLGDSP